MMAQQGSMCSFIEDRMRTTGGGQSQATGISKARQKRNTTGDGSGQAAGKQGKSR